uniref:Mid1-interacting protein 1 n=1 Tax=Oncorhynchus mykiss TaxID=8022 RepID=C1BHZ3_ONCMY|nr:Mid1-interacting protein 1 [Oncorhynchus mykiss]
MMQISSDPASNKNSLTNVMHRFIAATNNMDETIMVPSPLRDVPLEEQESQQVEVVENNNELSYPNKQRDMYEHYLLLKSIKNDMEWGLLKREMSGGASFLEMAVKQEEQQSITRGLLSTRAQIWRASSTTTSGDCLASCQNPQCKQTTSPTATRGKSEVLTS